MDKKKYAIILYNLIVSTLALLIVEILELRESYILMLFYSLNSFIVFSLLFVEEINYFKGLNLNLLVLIGCFSRFVIPSLTKSWGAIHGDIYSFLRPENIVNDYMFPTVVWMNIYYSLFYWCLVRFKSRYTIEDGIKHFFYRTNITYITIPLFVLGIAYNIAISFVPASFIPGIINTIFSQMATLAIVMQLFNSLFRQTKSAKVIFYIYIIVSLWQSITFGFYKGAIMMNFVYYLLYYFLDCKYNNKKLITPKLVVSGLALFLAIDIVIYPFMTTKRIVADWDAGTGLASNKYSNIEILLDVLQGKSLSERGDHTAASRLDAIEPNAFFYKECCTKGLQTTMIAKSNLELLVPRFINPNKHDSEAGLMVYAYAQTGSFDNYLSAISYNYIGQFASAYLMGRGILTIILALVNGWFIAFYYNFLLKHINNLLAIIFLLPLVLLAIMAFEEISDGGVLRTGYNCVQMALVAVLTTFTPRFLRVR